MEDGLFEIPVQEADVRLLFIVRHIVDFLQELFLFFGQILQKNIPKKI